MGVAPNTPVDSLSEISIASEPVDILGLDDVLPRRADYASTTVNIARSEAQRHAALSKYNPQVSMFLATGWDTGITYIDILTRGLSAASVLVDALIEGI